MPTIHHLRQHYKNDSNLLVLPIDVDHRFVESLRYFYDNGLELPVYAPEGAVPADLFAGELPTTAVIDKCGRIVYLHQGQDQYDTPEFYRMIDSLLRR